MVDKPAVYGRSYDLKIINPGDKSSPVGLFHFQNVSTIISLLSATSHVLPENPLELSGILDEDALFSVAAVPQQLLDFHVEHGVVVHQIVAEQHVRRNAKDIGHFQKGLQTGML